MKRLVCVLLVVVMVVGLAGCGEKSVNTPADTVPTPPPDEEVALAISYGIVPEDIQKDYDAPITYAEFSAILGSVLELTHPEDVGVWEKYSAPYQDANQELTHIEGMLILFDAAKSVRADELLYYGIPLEDYMMQKTPGVDFWTGVTWDYPLIPSSSDLYYNEVIANSEDENISWRCEYSNTHNAAWFAQTFSYGNGKTYFDYDEDSFSFLFGNVLTRSEAIRAAVRFYETSRYAVVVPVEDLVCTVTDEALEQAKAMPAATYDRLPDWNGYTIFGRVEFFKAGGSCNFDMSEVDAVAGAGFNFTRVAVDTTLLFADEEEQTVRPAAFEEMDKLLNWCAEAGIHVCFDLHDMPGFTTNAKDEDDILFFDQDAQDRFVRFWQVMAEHYKGVPSNLLSFNLLNEPHAVEGEGLTDEIYSALMLRAIDAIQEISSDRLIFVDMMDIPHHQPIEGLANEKIAQTAHTYYFKSTDDPIDTALIDADFDRYQAFSERTGQAIMVQEFGCASDLPNDYTLACTEALLSVLEERNIPWCSWCGEYGVFVNIGEEARIKILEYPDRTELREGGNYEDNGNGWYVYTDLMEVFKKYMK